MSDAQRLGAGDDGAKLQHRRALAAERMRRTRERRRDGMTCVNVDVRASEVAELVRRGLLAAEDRDDPSAIGAAVGNLLGEMFPCQG